MAPASDASPAPQAGRRVVPGIDVVVGVVGRAHGLRGDVTVELRTDEPHARFAPGSVLGWEGGTTTLTVAASRPGAAGRWLLRFVEAADRTAAESLRGRILTAHVDPSERPTGDADEYYDRQLRGLRALTPSGDLIGLVTDVVHLPAQDLLAIRTDSGDRLVPFVSELVPQIDLDAGTATIAAIEGLLSDVGPEDEP